MDAAGCTLWTTPDLMAAAVPVAGTMDTSVALPNSSSIAGLLLRHQVLAIEIGPAGDLTALTSSNALAMTIGVF